MTQNYKINRHYGKLGGTSNLSVILIKRLLHSTESIQGDLTKGLFQGLHQPDAETSSA